MSFKKLFLALVLVSSSVLANPSHSSSENDYFSVAQVETEIITLTDDEKTMTMEHTLTDIGLSEKLTDGLPGIPTNGRLNEGIEQTGKVIQLARDLIALGESFYTLILKGKPTIKTDYAPISVIPRGDDGKPVDILATESWSVPKGKKVKIAFKNKIGGTIASLEYMVLFSYGGTYNGKGAYITAAQVVPSKVSVSWGFDFNATLKLSGITNHGTKDDPIAGAVLVIQYDLGSIMSKVEHSDTFHITGKGDFVNYQNE